MPAHRMWPDWGQASSVQPPWPRCAANLWDMRVPRLAGVIERRVLVNYRVDPEAAARLLPAPFRPQLVRGHAMAGICLIRLARVRPAGMCDWVGIRSENAAHRFAVEWEREGQLHAGVYIPRRDTDSRLNHWAGGTIFPGVHHLADFSVDEIEDRIAIELVSEDGETRVGVRGRGAEGLPADSVFESLAEASAFFEGGSLGYSETETAHLYHGLELACPAWRCAAMEVEQVHSSYFEDRERFPAGTTAFDHALTMHDIEHEWISHDDLRGC